MKQCMIRAGSQVALFAMMNLCVMTPLGAAGADGSTALANQPIGSRGSLNVPTNVLFTPSVEFPTAVSQAHIGSYSNAEEYLGYFDPYKCYDYQNNGDGSYFVPRGFTIGTSALNGKLVKGGNRLCGSGFSGNFMNWVSMQTIDTFRWVMTGGDRAVDLPGKTVIQRAWASGQGGEANFATKSLSSNTSSLAGGWSGTIYARNQGLGRVVRIGTDSAKVADGTLNAGEKDYVVAVQACVSAKDTDPAGGFSSTPLAIPMLEDNCVPYVDASGKANYKPEGLIQANANSMRFGVFSYLNDPNINRDGGVLRARLKSVGPTVTAPGLLPANNPAREWNPADGTYYSNPDSADAASSGVSNSGVINYLNKFGLSGSYKTYDNVSEMYYGAIRYLRRLGSVPEWQNNLNASMIDSFPVITNWEDPIQYSCQRSVTVGIGDVNTHRDRNVPGGTNRSNEPTMPPLVASDGINFDSQTNSVGMSEGLGSNLGGTLTGATQAAYYIAGVANWAHTQDIRPDIPNKQTVDFYWVDVMEARVFKPNNQYWLAAKYGGFRDSNANLQPDLSDEWWKNKSTILYGGTTYKLPDNYFPASNPKAMRDALENAFSLINSDAARGGGTGLSDVNLGSAAVGGYEPSFDATNWTGDLSGNSLTVDASGRLISAQVFSAKAKLEAQAGGAGWSNNRRVVTGVRNGSTVSVVPFRDTSLPANRLAMLDSDQDVAKKMVSYLRGDRTNEGTLFRSRATLLGDIVDSTPAVIQRSQESYQDGANPGYSTFKSSNSTRAPVVLVGANDGMLHAFDGSLSGGNGGAELFAYVPAAQYETQPGFSSNNLANLANPAYSHRYSANGPIVVQDVDFSNVSNGSSNPSSPGTGWRTLAVAGLGKGGKSYVGLDMTTASTSSESDAANRILWEFTDPNMGYSYGAAAIMKTRRYGWVVALPSGYNNADGKGYIYLIDPATGALRETLRANEGTIADPLGLTHIRGYAPDAGDYTMDSIYAGDLKGNLWRWDLTAGRGASGAAPGGVRDATKIAQFTASGKAQPITSKPVVLVDPSTQERHVFVGTGRFLDESDLLLGQTQSLYGLRDGSRYSFWTSANMPSGQSHPFTRGNLQVVSSFSSGITPATDRAGWYYDLTGGSGGAVERVVVDTVGYGGTVSFATLTPSQDPCSPAGTGSLYVLGVGNARSRLSLDRVNLPTAITHQTIVSSGNTVALHLTFAAPIRETIDVAGANGGTGLHIEAGSGSGTSGSIVSFQGGMGTSFRRVSIREYRPD